MISRQHILLDLQQLVDLLLVLGEGEACAGVLDDIGKFLGHRVLVDRDRRTQRLRRASTSRAWAVVAHHDQPVAAAQAELGQARGQAADLVGDLSPAMRSARCRTPFPGKPGWSAGTCALGQQAGTCPERRSRYRPFPSSSPASPCPLLAVCSLVMRRVHRTR